MNNRLPITRDQFTKRLANLCLRSGLTGMPKDDTDQHILLKSAALMVGTVGKTEMRTEKEINERLQLWMLQVCQIENFDHVTLRRWLVDTGYLTRSSDGTGYRIASPDPRPGLFEEAVDQIDPVEAIRSAREEMERRKQEYLSKSKGR